MGEAIDVLHVVPSYHPARGGIEVLVENLVTELRTACGINSAVVAPGLPNQRPDICVHRDTRIFSIPVRPEVMAIYEADVAEPLAPRAAIKVMANIFSGLRRVFEEISPRLVHVHSVSMMAPSAAGIAASMGIPTLFHEHGLVDANPANFKAQVRDARWVCTVSEAVAESIRLNCSRKGRVYVIPNGIEDPMTTIGPSDDLFPSVAMIGRLSEEKGFDDGLEALNIVRRAFPKLRISLVGSGPQAVELHELARNLGLLEAIDFVGNVEHEKALEVAARSSIVLVPSRTTEGFSLVAAEAAFLGKPTVGTTIGGLPETVKDGVTGLLVAPGNLRSMADAIERLLKTPELRRSMGQQARARATRKFSVDRFANNVASLYTEIWNTDSSAPQPHSEQDIRNIS